MRIRKKGKAQKRWKLDGIQSYLVMMASHVSSQLVFMGIPLATFVIRAGMIVLPCMCPHMRAKVEIQREGLRAKEKHKDKHKGDNHVLNTSQDDKRNPIPA